MKYFIVCDTVLTECRSMVPSDVQILSFPFALHTNPGVLNGKLQERIDSIPGKGAEVLIGYGLCSRGTLGLVSPAHYLRMPRVHDCIAMLCGSQQKFHAFSQSELGTLYMTKRFIEDEQGTYHLMEYDTYVKKYGVERTERYIGKLLHTYTRGVLIRSAEYDPQPYRCIAQDFCAKYHLGFDEFPADMTLITALLEGKADGNIICKSPGEPVVLEDYL